MKFYKLTTDEGGRKKYAYAFPTHGYPTDRIECGVCGRSWNSFKNIVEKNLPFPITFTKDYFADFLSCEGAKLVNETVKAFLEEQGIHSAKYVEMPVVSGSELTETELKRIRNRVRSIKMIPEVKPKYYKLSAEIGARLHADSKVEWIDSGEYVCKHCGYGVGYKQKDFNTPYCILLDSWNGSDLFKVEEFGETLFCTERFKDLCLEQDFTGVLFKEVQAK